MGGESGGGGEDNLGVDKCVCTWSAFADRIMGERVPFVKDENATVKFRQLEFMQLSLRLMCLRTVLE